MQVKVLPSYPAPSFVALKELAEAVADVTDELQVDLVDGKFVPAISWPFTEIAPMTEFKLLKTLPSTLELEIDCMLVEPEQYLEFFTEVGAARVIIHFGSTSEYDEIIDHASVCGYGLGLAMTNDRPFDEVAELLPRFQWLQVMGISEVGKQGQAFDERTIETVKYFRSQFPDLEIAVDGGVNATTIPALVEAGVNRLTPGSAITKADDPATALQTLLKLANS